MYKSTVMLAHLPLKVFHRFVVSFLKHTLQYLHIHGQLLLDFLGLSGREGGRGRVGRGGGEGGR